MKTIVITAYNDTYAPLAEITVPRMEAWAKRHGYDFNCRNGSALNVPYGVHWFPLVDGVYALECQNFERAITLDVDQLITNPEFGFQDLTRGFHASMDWGNDAKNWYDISLCGAIWNRDCIDMMHATIGVEPDWRERPFPAQAPLRHMLQAHGGPRGDLSYTIHDRRWVNAVPEDVSPGNVPEPWQPTDFAAHLTMLPLSGRVALAHKILKQIE